MHNFEKLKEQFTVPWTHACFVCINKNIANFIDLLIQVIQCKQPDICCIQEKFY